MKTYKFLLVQLLLFVATSSFASVNYEMKDTTKNKKLKAKVEVVDESKTQTTESAGETDPYKVIFQKTQEIEKLQAELKAKDESLTAKDQELAAKEQELKAKNESIEAKDAEIQRLTESLNKYSDSEVQGKLEQADLVIARVSNDCLRRPFDQQRVTAALNNFQGMFTQSLQQKFAPVRSLIEKYGAYTEEIKAAFTTIESTKNNNKDLLNIISNAKAKQECISILKATNYYKECYNNDWTIPYLNKVIDDAIQRISNFKADKTNPLKLSDIWTKYTEVK